MFKVIDLPPEGKPQQSNDPALVGPPPEGTLRWIDLVDHDAEALELLRERFDFHPLAIEDCSSFELRSKIEEYEDYLFIVLHTFTEHPLERNEIQIHEIHAFLSESYLVTVHDNPLESTDAVWNRAAADRAVLSRGPCWVLYRTADTMVDAMFPLLDRIARELEDVEDAVLEGADEQDLVNVFSIKRTLVNMRRVIRPARDVVGMLSRRSDHRVDERTSLYFRDAYDHIQRVAETIDEARELASNAMDAYQTTISNRTNEVMKKLTIFSAIFLPLGFITGFWGQNFDDLPIGNEALFYLMIGSVVAIPIALLIWFSRRRWL